MNKELIRKAEKFGFNRAEAEFHVKFHEVSLRTLLKDFGGRRRRCALPGCTTFCETSLRIVCEDHAFTDEATLFYRGFLGEEPTLGDKDHEAM